MFKTTRRPFYGAFSLVELMVTLIIISVIISAMTPMITKKLKSQNITLGATTIVNSNTGSFNMDCTKFGEKCSLCDSNICAVCSETCLYNQVLNTPECSCKNCSELFESQCQQCNLNTCSLCEVGYYISAGKCEICPAGYKCDGLSISQCATKSYSLEGAYECISCSENCAECEKTTGECTMCDNNYTLENKECIANKCGDLAVEITINSEKYCITKYNIGDNSAFVIPSGINVVTAGSGTCTSSTSVFCCWQGITSNDCTASNGDYSGCTRTLCDWHAADKACSALGYLGKTWRLPTTTEWGAVGEQINEISINQGNKGLMLCDHTSATSGSAKCTNGTCKGTNYNICDPDNLWSSTKGQYFFLEGGVFFNPSDGQYAGLYGQAYSVRCITNL